MSIKKPRNCTLDEIQNIKLLYRFKDKKGRRKYSQKKLGKMFYVDQKTICNYLKFVG